jgi:DNA-binding response OmpR family regulator
MKTIKKAILIVEDNESLLHALVEKFTTEDFNVFSALNGQEGLEIALQNKPNVILLDILMPKMDGITMLEELRQKNQWGKQVPVVVLTNLEPNNDMIIRISKCTPTYYLIKSDFKLEEVVDKVNNALTLP